MSKLEHGNGQSANTSASKISIKTTQKLKKSNEIISNFVLKKIPCEF